MHSTTSVIDLQKEPPPPRLLSKKQLLQRVAFSYTTIWKMMKAGKFPKSHKIGGKVFWLESDVNAWIRANTES